MLWKAVCYFEGKHNLDVFMKTEFSERKFWVGGAWSKYAVLQNEELE